MRISRHGSVLSAMLLVALTASTSSAEVAITGSTNEIQENVRGCSDGSGRRARSRKSQASGGCPGSDGDEQQTGDGSGQG